MRCESQLVIMRSNVFISILDNRITNAEKPFQKQLNKFLWEVVLNSIELLIKCCIFSINLSNIKF